MAKIPDLTRVKKRKGIVHPDLEIEESFARSDPQRYRRGRYGNIENWRLLNELFLGYYGQDDAAYRRDFLSEWLEPGQTRKELHQVRQGIPAQWAREVITEDPRYGEPLPPNDIRSQINVIKRYMAIPETLELMANLSGGSQALLDLKRYGDRARKEQEDYAKFVAPLKDCTQFRDDYTLDYEWANGCYEKIIPFLTRLYDIKDSREQLSYYALLCAPYEFTHNGKRIPSSKPEFLDPDRREGTIMKAYNPLYFRHRIHKEGRKKGKLVVSKLNVPNDIHWGPDARNTYIHGPNDRGKSVYIRTIALNVHAAMAGLYSFSESCELSLPERILPCFDMGGTLESGHFVTGGRKVKYMLNHVKRNDLVLLDEAGGGTEPDAEKEIAKGIIGGLAGHDVTFFCATHDKGCWRDYIGTDGARPLMVYSHGRKGRVGEGEAESGYGMEKARELRIDPESVESILDRRLGPRTKYL